MPASFQEILNSPLFKFTVGEKIDGSPTEFHIHQEAVAHLSKPLSELIKGESQDSQDKSTTWDGVSKETFERFAQFAYTGDYSIPEPEPRKKAVKEEESMAQDSPTGTANGWHNADDEGAIEPPIDPESQEPNDFNGAPLDPENGVNSPSTKAPNRRKRKKRPKHPAEPNGDASHDQELLALAARSKSPTYSLVADLGSLTFEPIAPRNHHDQTCEPSSIFDPTQDYTRSLICHASLYNLATTQLISSLKALSLYKLHKTLSIFQLTDETASDIAALARCAYASGEESRLGEDGFSGLLGLVRIYMASNAWGLSQNDDFMDLLAGGGQIVKDFVRFQVQRNGGGSVSG